MNAQLKQLIPKRNKLRRHLRTYRKQLLGTNREITRLTEEPKRANWHRHLDRISKSKDSKQACSTVRSLSGRESDTTEKSLLYNGRVYACNRSKASSFVEEYAKINCRKCVEDYLKTIHQFRKLNVEVKTLRLQQACKVVIGISKSVFHVKHLAPKILMAVKYCGRQLA